MAKPKGNGNGNGGEEVQLPPEVKRELHRGMKLRAQAKSLKSEMEELDDQGKELVAPIMAAYDIKTYALEGVGKVISKTSSGSRINEGILREKLALEGMDPKTANRVIKASTKSWATDYVEFRIK